MCARFCLTGYVKDENGCDTCKCVDPCQVTVTVTESVTLRPYWETEGASVNSKTVSGVERQIGTKKTHPTARHHRRSGSIISGLLVVTVVPVCKTGEATHFKYDTQIATRSNDKLRQKGCIRDR